jgi:hypothetical protein
VTTPTRHQLKSMKAHAETEKQKELAGGRLFFYEININLEKL